MCIKHQHERRTGRALDCKEITDVAHCVSGLNVVVDQCNLKWIKHFHLRQQVVQRQENNRNIFTVQICRLQSTVHMSKSPYSISSAHKAYYHEHLWCKKVHVWVWTTFALFYNCIELLVFRLHLMDSYICRCPVCCWWVCVFSYPHFQFMLKKTWKEMQTICFEISDG